MFSTRITIRRDGFPTFQHAQPEWNSRDACTEIHWLSGLGSRWLRGLLDAGIEVVWATTWQHAANEYFAKPLGLPKLPVAVHGGGKRSLSAPAWKAMHLAQGFPGRPLLWIDDTYNAGVARVLDDVRRSVDRALTHVHWIREWAGRISSDDTAQVDGWLTLASTVSGHEVLRRERRRRMDRERRLIRR